MGGVVWPVRQYTAANHPRTMRIIRELMCICSRTREPSANHPRTYAYLLANSRELSRTLANSRELSRTLAYSRVFAYSSRIRVFAAYSSRTFADFRVFAAYSRELSRICSRIRRVFVAYSSRTLANSRELSRTRAVFGNRPCLQAPTYSHM